MNHTHHNHIVDDVAEFVVKAKLPDLSAGTLSTLKRNVLDSVACASARSTAN
jgi:2-methylcitrate dehydratase